MSTIIPGSICHSCTCPLRFAWTVQTIFEDSEGRVCFERRSNAFAYKGHDVHLKFTRVGYRYSVELCTPPSFPTLSKTDMIFRVENKDKTPLNLPNRYDVLPMDKIFWQYHDYEILAVYPDFQKDGGILTFHLYNVDPPRVFQTAEKLVHTPEHFNDISSLEGLSSDLSELLQNQDSSPDVELLCGEGHSIKVHKNIVCARSKVISTMLNSDMSEGRTGRIEIKDMSSKVFDHFVRYLYEGKLPDLNEYIAKSLYEAGDKYEVESLMRQCATFLEENMTTENACEMLVLGDAHSDQEFKQRVIDFIMEHEIPWQDDEWLPFQEYYPKLSNEVLYRFCKRQRTE